LILFSWYWN